MIATISQVLRVEYCLLCRRHHWELNSFDKTSIGFEELSVIMGRLVSKREPIDFVITWVDGGDPESAEKEIIRDRITVSFQEKKTVRFS